MTIAEIRASTKAMLSPADIAPILGSDPQTIRMTAKEHPELVRFPFTFVGAWMKIPRIGFLNWYFWANGGVVTG